VKDLVFGVGSALVQTPIPKLPEPRGLETPSRVTVTLSPPDMTLPPETSHVTVVWTAEPQLPTGSALVLSTTEHELYPAKPVVFGNWTKILPVGDDSCPPCETVKLILNTVRAAAAALGEALPTVMRLTDCAVAANAVCGWPAQASAARIADASTTRPNGRRGPLDGMVQRSSLRVTFE
jgi:hypothetical protein